MESDRIIGKGVLYAEFLLPVSLFLIPSPTVAKVHLFCRKYSCLPIRENLYTFLI
jgi:hypothetical protein